jgi:hypothetical protein
VIVLVAMVMVAASAAMARLVMMIMIVLVTMRVIVAVMTVSMGVTMMMVRVVMIADMGAALRLEGALHRSHSAALPTRKFRQGRIVLDVEGVIRNLGKAMVAAEMPGETRKAERVLGPDLQELLGSRLHLHKASILEPEGVAVVDGGLHVEIEQDLGPAFPLQRSLPAVPGLMIEDHRIDDTVGLHGGLTDDGGDAGHGFAR